MKKCTKHYSLLFIVVTLIMLAGMQSPVFSSGSKQEKYSDGETGTLVACPEPRPQICTMDYQPVCAELKNGSFKTFSSGCTSGADSEVIIYREGEYEEGK